MVARISPNEFGLLLTRLESKYSTTMVVRRILDLLAQGVQVDGMTVHFTACAGITLLGQDGKDTVSSLIKQSDVALSRARRMGRNQVQVFSPEMSRNVSRRIGMEAELAEAVEKRRFVVHYQPAVDLWTRRIVGAEALVRMVHPETGLVPPLEFIPLAEETGIIVAITEQVVREACRQVKAWQEEGKDIIFRGAPHLLLTSAPKSSPCPVQDTHIALATFQLMAHARGVGTVWDGLFMMVLSLLPSLSGRLGIPDDHIPGYAMAFGEPAVEYHRTVQRGPAQVNVVK